MTSGNILFICGSLNQTKMMHKISMHLQMHNLCFTPYYADGLLGIAAKHGLANFTPLGGKHKEMTCSYFEENRLKLDPGGSKYNYDLVFSCSDLIVQKNIRKKNIVLVQEGMTDPINLRFYLARYLGLPRWLASTSTTGLSDHYNVFCVASEGYRDLFIANGVNPGKIRVTGIPNFDDLKCYANNNFPHNNFALVATSDSRETFKYENRKQFIENALRLSDGRQVIFKLHPNENFKRATGELTRYAPGAIVYTGGDINEMIANCDVLVTRFSTVVYVGIILGKKVYSSFDLNKLKKLTPIQNGNTSAEHIARVGMELMETKPVTYYAGKMKEKYLVTQN